MPHWIELGVFLRPHGIKGECCIDWYADSPSLLDAPLFLQQGQRPPRPLRLRAWRMHKGRPLLLPDGVDDRTAAEGLRGARILIDRASLPETDEDEVYVEDLLGCTVFLDDGRRLGCLDQVEYPAGREVWGIRTADGREVLFPAEPCFIVGFDLGDPQGPRVTIAPPDGLLDIYLGTDTSAAED